MVRATAAVRAFGTATAAVVLALAGCTAGDPPTRSNGSPSLTGGVTLTITETEYGIEVEPRDGLIPADYTLVVRNRGSVAHAIAIRGPGVDDARTKIIPAGTEAVELTVRLAAGTYEVWCPVGDHRPRGMKTSLVVEAL